MAISKQDKTTGTRAAEATAGATPKPDRPEVETVNGAATLEEASVSPLKKRELIDGVAAETGLKRREVRAVTEAVLSVMGGALADGRSLNLEPLGKLRVAKSTDNEGSRVLTCKLRRKTPAPAEE